MVFPIRQDFDSRSIFGRLADLCRDHMIEDPLKLSTFYEFIPKALSAFNLSLGSEEEFFNKIYPLCIADLPEDDIKSKDHALRILFRDQKRASNSLEECLNYRQIPKFETAVPPLLKFLEATGMAVDDKNGLMWLLDKYYSKDAAKYSDSETFSELNFVSAERSIPEQKQISTDETRALENPKLEVVGEIIETLEKKIAISPQEFVERSTNGLLDQKKMLKRLQSICRCILFEEAFFHQLVKFIQNCLANGQKSGETLTPRQLRDRLISYHPLRNQTYQTGQTVPFQLHFDSRFNYQLGEIVMKFGGKREFVSSAQCKKHYGAALVAIDDLLFALRDVVSQSDQKIDGDTIENFEPKINCLIYYKHSYLSREFCSKFALLADELKNESVFFETCPVYSAFRESIKSKQFYHWMFDAFELFRNFHSENRGWFRDLYQICYNKLCDGIKNSKSDKKRELYHYKLCSFSEIEQRNLPTPHELESLFDSIVKKKGKEPASSSEPLSSTPKSKSKKSSKSNKSKSKRFDVSSRRYLESGRTQASQDKETLNRKTEQLSDHLDAKRGGDQLVAEPKVGQSERLKSSLPSHVKDNEKVIRSCSGSAKFPFAYQNRVKRWFCAKAPLDPILFEDYQDHSLDKQHQKILQHSFSQLADFFIPRCERLIDEKTQVERYFAAAELIFQGMKKRGYVLWVVRNGVCYHRYFHLKSNDGLIDITMHNRFQEIDYPALRKDIHFQKPILSHFGAKNSETCNMNNLLGVFTIVDRAKDYCLRLYLKPCEG